MMVIVYLFFLFLDFFDKSIGSMPPEKKKIRKRAKGEKKVKFCYDYLD